MEERGKVQGYGCVDRHDLLSALLRHGVFLQIEGLW